MALSFEPWIVQALPMCCQPKKWVFEYNIQLWFVNIDLVEICIVCCKFPFDQAKPSDFDREEDIGVFGFEVEDLLEEEEEKGLRSLLGKRW
ncbi:hypothetical protein VNO78_22186 [Psophocarpus tetragonolobus]|uniref:Uncharacterized protein n=1 Tax=Psophocarpus tetragonolobus TaxID=3891 RepID=A0AAN9SC52_PSOTE